LPSPPRGRSGGASSVGSRPWKGKASTQSSGRPSRDRRDQRERVAVRSRRGVLAQVAYVFVVEVDVDEAAQLTLVREDLLAQVGELGGECNEHFAHGGAVDGDGIPRRRELTQGRRDQYLGHVSKSAPLLARRFDRSWAENNWRGETRLFESIRPRKNTTGRNSLNR